jgi:uncharacterized repeat protein (TIGR02059 family)
MTAPLLKSQEILLVSSNDTTVNGDAGSGIEVVIIGQGVTGAILDINVERVALNGNSSDFTFQKQGSDLVIISGSSTVATISIQADANGTQVTFNNGTVNVFAGQAGMTFGGVTVGTIAANITPLSIDPYLITSSTTPPPVPGDTTPPTLVSADTSTAGQIRLTFDEDLNTTTAPPTAFEVTVDGVLRSIASLGVMGTTVYLSLSTPVYTGQLVTVTYTDPTAGDDANAIQDLAGNDAASITSTQVTNNSTVPVPPPDTTPPTYQGVSVDWTGDGILILYSEQLTDTTTVPTSAFVVKANGVSVTVDSMRVINSQPFVRLFLPTGSILKGQTVTVGYVAPGGSGPDVLKDLAGNPAATSPEYLAYNFSTVTNPSDLTLPILMGAFSGGGNTLLGLSYNEPLGGAVVPPSAFTVTVNGSPVNVVSVQPIIAESNSVYMELASAVPLGSTATISYTDPGGANGIIDVAGNRAASYTNRAVYTGVAP